LTELDEIDLDNDEDYRTYQSYRNIVLTNLQEKLYQGLSADALLENIKSQSIKNGFINSLIYELDPKIRIATEFIKQYKNIAIINLGWTRLQKE
jgi:hypothetical protein